MTVYDPDKIRNERLALEELRQREREHKPLWQRLHEVTDRALLLSTVPSAGISEYTTHGKTEGSEPPQQQTIDTEPIMRRVQNAVEELEAGLDAHFGLGESRNYTTMLGHEKDRELLDRW